MSAAPMIELRRVVKTFKNAAGEFTVLKGIDMTLYQGEFVAIVGKSGSGKSTLLNMMTGIDHPTGGQVVVNATDLYERMNESQRSLWRGRNMGIVFQFFQLLPMLSLLENVMLPMDYARLYDFEERPQRAMELLKLVGLEAQANKLPVAVSTGQQQAAAIARALATDPPLLVADEPTGNLDSRSAQVIIDLFQSLADQGKTIVMVTHDPSLTERTNRTIIISDGELVNEAVASALPLLNHRQMLAVTKTAQRKRIEAGRTILKSEETVDEFFIIESGSADIVLTDKERSDTIISRLGAGQFFGEIELLRGGKSIASVRASGDGPVEVLALQRETFLDLLKQSPITEGTIGKIVQRRLQENRSADRRK
jgi:ABC-type lipoprotein export system ATPase subunit